MEDLPKALSNGVLSVYFGCAMIPLLRCCLHATRRIELGYYRAAYVFVHRSISTDFAMYEPLPKEF